MPHLRCEHPITKAKRQFALRKAITTIGRAKGNDVVLDDPMVAPTHANLVRSPAGYSLNAVADLMVNGKKAKSVALNPGDQLLIGAWTVTFAEGEPQEEAPAQPEAMPVAELEKLVNLSQEMLKDTSPERLFRALLEGLVSLTRAEKGFVLVLRDGQRNVAAWHNVDQEKLGPQGLSDSIVKQVIEHLQPVIVSDAMRDARFGRSQSVVDLKLSSVMCVPLVYRKDLLGLIYLGNDAITDLFTDRDLKLLQVYASQASLILYHALALNQLQVDNRNLRTRLEQSAQGQMIGTCEPMKRMFQVLRRIAPTDLSVLILGETGTGKELVARELHNLSPRRDKTFVAINCGAIPENLLESELFGHKKGSFTGAVTDKVGKIEAATEGTLFLDEIGEMPMNLQVKLLRVLQEQVIERIGELAPRPINVRVVAATNKDLEDHIRKGHFREDLFYRLNEIALNLPPLRERGEDISVLAQYFLNKYKAQYNGKAGGFTNQALAAMNHYTWPGNVRELENRVKKAVIMSDRALLNPDDLSLPTTDKREIKPLNDASEEFKLGYIRQVLDWNHGNKAQTARDLGVDARTIFRYLEKLDEEAAE